jgi:shikimate kinase
VKRTPSVVLIGPPGVGKSAVGPLVAERLGAEFRDTDADVAVAAGKPVSDIFIEDGEQAFRELEHAAAITALRQQAERGGVLALGSGAVLDDRVQRLMDGEETHVVYLAADFRTVAQRVGLDRPRVVVPGNPRGRLRDMLEQRRLLYERLATVTVDTDEKDAEEVAAEVAAKTAGSTAEE